MRKTTLVALAIVLGLSAAAFAQETTVHVTAGSHIDLAWRWREAETVQVCHDTFKSVLDLMDFYDNTYLPENPLYYQQSTAQFYQWMKDAFPNLYDRIRRRIAEGRWEVVGGCWDEHDTNIPLGEGLAREYLYGKLWFEQQLGVDPVVGWLPDSFGYNAQMPQFMARSGIPYFAYSKTNFNETHEPDVNIYKWRALDGSEVLTTLTVGHYNQSITAGKLRGQIQTLRERHPQIHSLFYSIGVGNHGGGVSQWTVENAMALDAAGYDIRFGTMLDYFESLDPAAVTDVIQDERYLEWHRGTYTTRARVKDAMRRAEILLENAEKIAFFAQDAGLYYPQASFRELWQIVCKNHFHDILPGSSIEEVYALDYDQDMRVVNAEGGRILAESMAVVAAQVDTEPPEPGGIPLVVFNTLADERTSPVALSMAPEDGLAARVIDADGFEIPCQYSMAEQALLFVAPQVPPMGYAVFFVVSGGEGTSFPEADAPMEMENPWLYVAVDPDTGHVAGIYDKRSGRQVIEPDAFANVLQLYKEGMSFNPAWNLVYDKYEQSPAVADDVRYARMTEDGPVRQVAEIARSEGPYTFIQRVILYKELARVDFELDVMNWGILTDWMLKVAFPLNLENHYKMMTCDIPYGSYTRIHDNQDRYKYEGAAQKWVNVQSNNAGGVDPSDDYGVGLLSWNKNGFDLLNDGPGEGLSDGRANILRMTVLKSSRGPGNTLGFGGVITDRGDFHTRYALVPHAGGWEDADVPGMGWDYNNPLIVHLEPPHPGALPQSMSFASVDRSDVHLGAIKRPEREPDGSAAIVRLVETHGRDTTARLRFPGRRVESVQEVDLVERPVDGDIAWIEGENEVGVFLGHDEFRTLRVGFGPASEDYEDDDEAACGCAASGEGGPGAPWAPVLLALILLLCALGVRCIVASKARRAGRSG